jgi:hypothetical protein
MFASKVAGMTEGDCGGKYRLPTHRKYCIICGIFAKGIEATPIIILLQNIETTGRKI